MAEEQGHSLVPTRWATDRRRAPGGAEAHQGGGGGGFGSSTVRSLHIPPCPRHPDRIIHL